MRASTDFTKTCYLPKQRSSLNSIFLQILEPLAHPYGLLRATYAYSHDHQAGPHQTCVRHQRRISRCRQKQSTKLLFEVKYAQVRCKLVLNHRILCSEITSSTWLQIELCAIFARWCTRHVFVSCSMYDLQRPLWRTTWFRRCSAMQPSSSRQS